MRVCDLVRHWEATASGDLTDSEFPIRLPLEDAAKLAALAEMYPKRSIEQLLSDLVAAALHDVEQGLPYQAGNKVIAEDEMGDPLYEDIGPTPRFLALSRKHLQRLREAKQVNPH